MTDAAKAQAEDDCSDERSIPANSMSPFVAPLRRAVVPQLCLIAGLDGSEVHAVKANDSKRTSAGTAQGTHVGPKGNIIPTLVQTKLLEP